jgi:hypothetical protein
MNILIVNIKKGGLVCILGDVAIHTTAAAVAAMALVPEFGLS